MSFFIPEALAQTAEAAPAGFDIQFFVMMGGLVIFMYFIMIRPQQKRQKEHQKLVESLGKGDEVILSSGMLGKISAVDDLYVTVDAGKGMDFKFQKSSVHAVLPKGTIKAI